MRLLPLVIITFLLTAAPARAGTYEHHTLSPAVPGLDGWSPRVVAPHGYVGASGAARGLSVQFWARAWFAPGALGEWTYTAPADTTVAGWTIERIGRSWNWPRRSTSWAYPLIEESGLRSSWLTSEMNSC